MYIIQQDTTDKLTLRIKATDTGASTEKYIYTGGQNDVILFLLNTKSL